MQEHLLTAGIKSHRIDFLQKFDVLASYASIMDEYCYL